MAEDRYARQTILPGVGEEGQQKLAATRAVIIGCGGLGSPCAAYLAGAGVGHIRLVDDDSVSTTNLHRQVFFAQDSGADKVMQLADHLRKLNGTIIVETLSAKLTAFNARAILSGATVVLDCTDDALTKHLLNDACVTLRIPLVYAAAQGFAGYLALFENSGGGINLRDLHPRPDPTLPDCATTGVLPTAVGTLALLQANATLCYLLGIGSPPVDCLLTYDALDNRQHRVRLSKTYTERIAAPWRRVPAVGPLPEVDPAAVQLADYDGVYSMLSAEREAELPAGVLRLSGRNPLGQALDNMKDGGRYLVYCNSGKLSLVLATQVRKARPAVGVVSLRGGRGGLEILGFPNE